VRAGKLQIQRRMARDQIDLFGAKPVFPEGFRYQSELIDAPTEARLLEQIGALPFREFEFQGYTAKRRVISFGWHYDFNAGRFEEADPLPDWLLPLRAKAAAFADLSPADLVHALLIRYDPGAGIGWHRDRPVFEHVVGISLGNRATLRLRRRSGRGFERASAELPPRSIYHLSGEVRHEWEHSIAAMDVPRWSITFRSRSSNGSTRATSRPNAS